MKNKPIPNYFVVNRGLLFSDRWLSEPFTRGQAWVDLFGLAQHTEGHIRIRGIRIEIKRGQLAYSQISLSKRWKWSRGKVKRYLKELEKQNDISLKTVQQTGQQTEQQIKFITTLITVKKYDFWQGCGTADDTANGQQTDSRRTANGTYTKNDKNVKNINGENPEWKNQFYLKEKKMETIYLDDLGEPIEKDNTPKKYTNKKKLYSRIAIYYMSLSGQKGDVIRYYKDVAELVVMSKKIHDTEEKIEKEIKARIDIVKKHFETKNISWGLNAVIKNWTKLVNWK